MILYLSRGKVRHVSIWAVQVLMAGVGGAGHLQVVNVSISWNNETNLTITSCSVSPTSWSSLFSITQSRTYLKSRLWWWWWSGDESREPEGGGGFQSAMKMIMIMVLVRTVIVLVRLKMLVMYMKDTRSGKREPEGGGGFQSTTAVDPVQSTQWQAVTVERF